MLPLYVATSVLHYKYITIKPLIDHDLILIYIIVHYTSFSLGSISCAVFPIIIITTYVASYCMYAM